MKKRILSFLLAMVMIITCSSTLAVSADEIIEGGELTLGNPVVCTVEEVHEQVRFTFTAPEDGIFCFYSEADKIDPYAKLYLGNALIGESDDDSNSLNFSLRAELTKDTVYTFICYSIGGTGSFKINTFKVTLPNALKIDGKTSMYAKMIQNLWISTIPEVSLEDPIISFTSSNPEVAVVTNDGQVYALKEGTTTITAKSASGAEGTLDLTVKPHLPLALETPVSVREYTCFSFTPATTDYYRIFSADCGPTDPYVTLYSAEGEFISEFDDSNAGKIISYNYSDSIELIGGTTYILEVKDWDEKVHHTLCVEKTKGIVDLEIVTPPAKTTFVDGFFSPDLSGTVLRVIFSDNTTAEYPVTSQPYDRGFALGNYPLHVYPNFEEEPCLDFYCGDGHVDLPITLIPNPVERIEVKAITIDPFYKEVDGRDNMGSFIYDVYSHLPTSLTLEVFYENASPKTIPCEYKNGDWYCDGYPVFFSADNQVTTPWVLGDQNVMTAHWLDRSANFFVSVIENNVDHLELIKAPTRVYSLGDYHYVQHSSIEDCYYFNEADLTGMEFKIHYVGGNFETITYDDAESIYNTIKGISYETYIEPYESGEGTIGYFTYLGHEIEFPVTVRGEMAYTDIAYDWAYDGIVYCYNNGLMLGTSETTFAPKMAMSRAMAVTALWRLMGSPDDAPDAGFADVENTWYTEAINWAFSEGIVNGVGNNCFAPDRNISREEMFTLFYRFADHYGMDTSTSQDFSSFLDADKVQSWAEEAMAWAIGSNLVGGAPADGGLVLMPAMEATREQTATLFMRFLY